MSGAYFGESCCAYGICKVIKVGEEVARRGEYFRVIFSFEVSGGGELVALNVDVRERAGVELAIFVFALTWPPSADGVCEVVDELLVPVVGGRVGGFASVDDGVRLGH